MSKSRSEEVRKTKGFHHFLYLDEKKRKRSKKNISTSKYYALLTIGFNARTRWTISETNSEIVEFGYRQAELCIDILGGQVEKTGEIYGGTIELEQVIKKVRRSEKHSSKSGKVSLNAKKGKDAGIGGGAEGFLEVGNNSGESTEVVFSKANVVGVVEDDECPVWTFTATEGELLHGNLNNVSLCEIRSKNNAPASAKSRLLIHPCDIDICRMPKRLSNKLKVVRLQDILIRRLEQSIRDAVYSWVSQSEVINISERTYEQ